MEKHEQNIFPIQQKQNILQNVCLNHVQSSKICQKYFWRREDAMCIYIYKSTKLQRTNPNQFHRFHWPGPGVHTSWQRHPGSCGETHMLARAVYSYNSWNPKSAQQVDRVTWVVRRKQLFSNQSGKASLDTPIPLAKKQLQDTNNEYCFRCYSTFQCPASAVFSWIISKSLDGTFAHCAGGHSAKRSGTIHTVPAANWPFQLLPMGSLLSPTWREVPNPNRHWVTHRINYLHEWLIFMVNVGIYILYMDGMGYRSLISYCPSSNASDFHFEARQSISTCSLTALPWKVTFRKHK